MPPSSDIPVKEQLLLSQQKIESILGGITGNFFVLDRNWRFLHVNHSLQGESLYSREELLGKTLWEVFPHWQNTKCNDLLHRALSEKGPTQFEFFDEFRSKWYEINAHPMAEGLSVHLHDISPRKAVEEQGRLAFEEVSRLVQERTSELQQSNQALQVEILERKKAEREILEITQEEQKRFGSQLHDGLCQELTAILLFAKGLTQKMEKENRLDIAELKKISDLLHGAVDQARDTARGLYPGELEGSSLMHTLEELAASIQQLGVSCRFDCPEPILFSDNNVATHLYKIAQEAVSNAVQHGKPQSILVELTKQDDLITLCVKDDGIGFTPDSKTSKGIGLKIMKYRANIIGASFEIGPNSPHGTIVKCGWKAPIKESRDS